MDFTSRQKDFYILCLTFSIFVQGLWRATGTRRYTGVCFFRMGMWVLLVCFRVVSARVGVRFQALALPRGGGASGVRAARERVLFGAEELAHPFSSFAGWLADSDDAMRRCGARSVRSALLALSVSSKALKGMDGAAHSLSSIGASAASGASVAERVAAARDVSGRGKSALKRRASAASRAKAAEEAFYACEMLRESARATDDDDDNDDEVSVRCELEDGSACAVSVRRSERAGEPPRLVLVFVWLGDAASVLRAADAAPVEVEAFAPAGRAAPLVAANSVFWHLALRAIARLDAQLTRATTEGHSVLCLGHGAGGAIAALVAAALSGAVRPVAQHDDDDADDTDAARQSTPPAVTLATNSEEEEEVVVPRPRPRPLGGFAGRCEAVAIGCAPCVSRAARLDAERCVGRAPRVRVTTVALGDDLVVRASRGSLRRLRRRLRRFLPSSSQSGDAPQSGFAALSNALPFARIGMAMAGSALEQSLGAAKRAATGANANTNLGAKSTPDSKSSASAAAAASSEDDLALPGDVFFLKPRADSSVNVYKIARTNRAREELIWQLNDILLSKSMLAHHTLSAYINALERV